MTNKELKDIKDKTKHWWYCDNILDHPGEVGLPRMDFPQVFILIRDYDTAYWASYEKFRDDIIEINFFNPKDRVGANLEEITTEAWNFLALVEEEEDRQYEEHDGYFD